MAKYLDQLSNPGSTDSGITGFLSSAAKRRELASDALSRFQSIMGDSADEYEKRESEALKAHVMKALSGAESPEEGRELAQGILGDASNRADVSSASDMLNAAVENQRQNLDVEDVMKSRDVNRVLARTETAKLRKDIEIIDRKMPFVEPRERAALRLQKAQVEQALAASRSSDADTAWRNEQTENLQTAQALEIEIEEAESFMADYNQSIGVDGSVGDNYEHYLNGVNAWLATGGTMKALHGTKAWESMKGAKDKFINEVVEYQARLYSTDDQVRQGNTDDAMFDRDMGIWRPKNEGEKKPKVTNTGEQLLGEIESWFVDPDGQGNRNVPQWLRVPSDARDTLLNKMVGAEPDKNFLQWVITNGDPKFTVGNFERYFYEQLETQKSAAQNRNDKRDDQGDSEELEFDRDAGPDQTREDFATEKRKERVMESIAEAREAGDTQTARAGMLELNRIDFENDAEQIYAPALQTYTETRDALLRDLEEIRNDVDATVNAEWDDMSTVEKAAAAAVRAPAALGGFGTYDFVTDPTGKEKTREQMLEAQGYTEKRKILEELSGLDERLQKAEANARSYLDSENPVAQEIQRRRRRAELIAAQIGVLKKRWEELMSEDMDQEIEQLEETLRSYGTGK